MRAEVVQEMESMIDEAVSVPAFNHLIKQFISEKRQENSHWADITRTTYFMLGGKDQTCINRVAAITELIMLSLDIVDDLQDNDNAGKPWIQCRWDIH